MIKSTRYVGMPNNTALSIVIVVAILLSSLGVFIFSISIPVWESHRVIGVFDTIIDGLIIAASRSFLEAILFYMTNILLIVSVPIYYILFASNKMRIVLICITSIISPLIYWRIVVAMHYRRIPSSIAAFDPVMFIWFFIEVICFVLLAISLLRHISE